MLVGAAGYAAALPGRASTPNAQSTGMYGRYGAPESQVDFTQATPPAGTVPMTFPGGGGGSGGGGKAKKAKELEDYIRQEQDFLRQLAQIGQNRLETTMGLSNEELNILKAQSKFKASNAIN